MLESVQDPKQVPGWLQVLLVAGSFVAAILEVIRVVSQPDFVRELAAFLLFVNGTLWFWRFRAPVPEGSRNEKSDQIGESHK